MKSCSLGPFVEVFVRKYANVVFSIPAFQKRCHCYYNGMMSVHSVAAYFVLLSQHVKHRIAALYSATKLPDRESRHSRIRTLPGVYSEQHKSRLVLAAML